MFPFESMTLTAFRDGDCGWLRCEGSEGLSGEIELRIDVMTRLPLVDGGRLQYVVTGSAGTATEKD